eukprot:jgi/Hompol1/2969/HPOL_006259-RA
MEPVVRNLASTLSTFNLKFYQVNTDLLEEIAQANDIRVLPTYIVIKHGHALETIRGPHADQLEVAIKSALA